MKCIVKGCSNHKHEGVFLDTLCVPCYTMLTQGRKMSSEAWFAKPWVGLTKEDRKDILSQCEDEDRGYIAAMAEAILREKNS